MAQRLRDRFKSIGGLGGRLTNFGSFGIIGGGLGGLRNLFVGSAATAALAFPIKLAANLELVTAQLNVFIGDGKKTQQVILGLQEFSAVAGQSFEAMAQQLRLLMTRDIGADEALESIKAMAALAGGSEEEFQQLTKALADVKSATRLNGEEMRQFKNTAFNPFVEIAKRTGETFDELKNRMEAGGIAFWEVRDALLASVRAGGHFHGMLDKIAGTLIGQMRMALTKFKLAILPLGGEMLKPLTNFFKALNGIIPKFAEFAKANAKWFNALLQSLAATATAATAFVALGLALGLVGIALAGLTTVIGILSTAFFPFLAIVGLIVVAVKMLGITFADLKAGFNSVFGGIIAQAKALLAGVKAVFNGIMDAMKGGDFKLAADILWAGLQTLWAAGLEKLNGLWIKFKFGALQVLSELKTGIQKIWIDLMEWMGRRLVLLGAQLEATFLRLTGQLTTERANEIAQQAGATRAAISQGAERDRAALDSQNKAAQSLLETWKQVSLAVSGGNWADAKKRLDELIAKAKELAKEAGGGKNFFPDVNFGGGGLAAGLAEAKNINARHTFDTRFARQMFGATPQDELAELKKIEKNTRMQNRRAGLPVI